MTRFEFLYVLISAIVAFAIGHIALSWAELLKRRAEVQFYWVHVAWSALIVLILLQLWWGNWKYSVVDQWTFFAMAAIAGELILLMLTAFVITPSRRLSGPIDLQAFFYDNSQVFFILSALLMFTLALVNWIVAEQHLLRFENVIRAVAISVAMFGATTRSTRVHTALVSSGFLLLFLFIALQIAKT